MAGVLTLIDPIEFADMRSDLQSFNGGNLLAKHARLALSANLLVLSGEKDWTRDVNRWGVYSPNALKKLSIKHPEA